VYSSPVRLDEFIKKLEATKDLDKAFTVRCEQLRDGVSLVFHSSPLWKEHGIALFVVSKGSSFCFHYSIRNSPDARAIIDSWAKLLSGEASHHP